jgi:hypothetical protein
VAAYTALLPFALPARERAAIGKQLRSLRLPVP